MIYERRAVRWLVATTLLVAALTGTVFCVLWTWQENDWSYALLAMLFVCGVYPFIRELRLLKK
jgi:hypothetical protein